MNKYLKILLGVAGVLVVGLGIAKFWPTSGDTKLSQCFSDRQIEWTESNRAAEAAKRGIWGWEDSSSQQKDLFEAMGCEGLGFSVVTDFQKALSAPMTNSQTFVPSTSLTLKDGTILSMSLLGSEVFLTLEPGAANEEIVVCTAIDATLKRFTGCTRGLAFSGSSTAAVTANQKTHSSGSTVVMSNVHYVYNNYVDKITTSTQNVAGVLNFSLFPKTTSTTAIPSSGGELATKYYVDNVGAGGFTCSNVSSTLGLQCLGTVPEKVGINASSTTALGFDSSSGKIYLNVSSTGGLAFDTSITPAATLYFDKTRDYTFTGNLISSGSLTVNTPTQNTYAANKTYVDSSLQTNNATGTAGENVTLGQALYASSTGSLYLADADATTSTYSFVGIALNTTNTSGIVTYARPGGIVTNQSGLTAGQYYYISATPGSIVTPGAANKVFARVGFAMSATNMLVMRPTFEQMANGTASIIYNGSTSTITLGFVPKEVELYCIGNTATAGNSHGFFTWDQAGTATQVSQGVDDDTSPFTVFTTNRACKWQQGGADEEVIVATTTRGFTLSGVGSGVTQNVYWRAKYWDNGFGGN